MSGKSKWDYLKAIYFRYRKASKPLRSRILEEFCQVCRYHSKYAMRLLNNDRRATYGVKAIGAHGDLASHGLSGLGTAQSSPAAVLWLPTPTVVQRCCKVF
jgi:hypothetical protein